jgi:hypothetical protein
LYIRETARACGQKVASDAPIAQIIAC